jgi:hypothetical protein
MKAVADKYIKSANLEELMRVNEDGRSIKILVKSGANDSQESYLCLLKELKMMIQC